MKDKFNFEDRNIDFPFYNGEPFLSRAKWILIGVSFLIVILFLLVFRTMLPSEIGRFAIFLIPLLTLFYVSEGNLGLFIKKLRKSDLKLMFIVYVLTFIYSFSVGILLNISGIHINPNPVNTQLGSISFWISFPFQIFAEELIKLFAFLMLLFATYTTSKNRKLSIIIATLITAIFFGLIHIETYGNLLSVILLQGIGSLFMIYAYVKTKNILVSFIPHLLFDLISFLVIMFGNVAFL